MSIVITTPTGNIGGKLVRLLLEAGERPRILVRDPARLAPSVRDEAEIMVGDLGDAGFVRRATEGAKALFWLTPPPYGAPDPVGAHVRSGEIAAEAVRANAIPYVVHMSSEGAGERGGLGLIDHLAEVETRLDATGVNVLHLRPTFFFENTLFQAAAISREGTMVGTLPPDLRFPYVATRDIAVAAAMRLLARNWTGVHVQPLHGPADLTPNEMAGELSVVLGRPVHYHQIRDEELLGSALEQGFAPAFARDYVAMFAGLRELGERAFRRSPRSTTSTPFAAWVASEMAPALRVALGATA